MTVGGEADIHGAPQLSEELQRLAGDGWREIIVDPTDEFFIDSTILGVLLKASRRARDEGGTLVLVSDDPRITRVRDHGPPRPVHVRAPARGGCGASGSSGRSRHDRHRDQADERLATLVEHLRDKNAQLGGRSSRAS